MQESFLIPDLTPGDAPRFGLPTPASAWMRSSTVREVVHRINWKNSARYRVEKNQSSRRASAIGSMSVREFLQSVDWKNHRSSK
jgi:hypothetical protein